MPLLATNDLLENSRIMDFVPLPKSDYSFSNCLLECIRYMSRVAGLNEDQALDMTMLCKLGMMKRLRDDMKDLKAMSTSELDLIELAIRSMCRSVRTHNSEKGFTEIAHLNEVLACTEEIERLATGLDSRKQFALPQFSLSQDDKVCFFVVLSLTKFSQHNNICDWKWFDRILRTEDIEPLAGNAALPPILRPVELTLVPDKVTDFAEAAAALRQALNLCILLSNQSSQIKNSHTLRLCLIHHLFVRVIPLPLGLSHPDRDAHCFWHAQPMRYESQADMLRLIHLLSRHFSASSFSVKTDSLSDATRLLTHACMTAVADALFRKVAFDIPCQASLHYSGKAAGPVIPFGFDGSQFIEESEFLIFPSPEAAAARSQVLDYFSQIKNGIPESHLMFKFEKTNSCSKADRLYIDQLCLQMGFIRFVEDQYMVGQLSSIMDYYPNLAVIRDMVFILKLLMQPSAAALPEKKSWDPAEAALRWTSKDGNYKVKAFDRTLECVLPEEPKGKPIRGIMNRFLVAFGIKDATPRVSPSKANPSVLIGERVDTEDDILHIKSLPDFDGTMGGRDSEFMLQYLLAPYLRIPLMLNFFAHESRIRSLRNKNLQDVLDAALFEPSLWQEDLVKNVSDQIPGDNRESLSTSAGLLFNEIIKSPKVVLAAIHDMILKVIDMDTGRFSAVSEAILYIIRLSVRIEGFLLFLLKNRDFHSSLSEYTYNGGYHEAQVRGLESSDSVISDAVEYQVKIRFLLDGRILKILARWIKRAKKEGKALLACKLHAHLAFLYRNVDPSQLDEKKVFTILSSQVYIFSTIDLDMDAQRVESSTDLGVPYLELYDMFQRNRNQLITFLDNAPMSRNAVMDGILKMVEVGNTADDGDSVVRGWIPIERKGFNFRGKFVPENEFNLEKFEQILSIDGKSDFESWMRETTTMVLNTEINVQLGEFTIKKHHIQALPQFYYNVPDFKTIFKDMPSMEVLQCAEVRNSSNRTWVRLIGRGYDLQYWKADDRPMKVHFVDTYERCREVWIKELIEPWRSKAFPGIEFFVGSCSDEYGILHGLAMHPQGSNDRKSDEKRFTLKEIICYRYPRVFHVYNVVEHGRRFYRTLIFSSDSNFSPHDMPIGFVPLTLGVKSCCGDPKTLVTTENSLVVLRDSSLKEDSVQHFIPSRLLLGAMPSALLTLYNFWQNDDDSLIGYMPIKKNPSYSRSILFVTRDKSKRRGDWRICRSYILEDPSLSESQIAYSTSIDPQKPSLYLVNLLAVLSCYRSNLKKDDVVKMSGSVGGDLCNFKDEASSLHALIRMMLRLDSLSSILAWSLSDPSEGPVTVDLIELPRLRLTFEKRQGSKGLIRYFCIEHSGLYLAGFKESLGFHTLLYDLPHSVLLSNDDADYFVMLSGTNKPVEFRTSDVPPSSILTVTKSDDAWVEKSAESAYFVYPVHSSGCFMSSKSVSSTLYLLLFRLLMKNYSEAFKLIESCVCDRPMTAQEQQIYSAISECKYDVHPDANACRLKLYIVTYGCADVMPYRFSIEDELSAYITHFEAVSCSCRLSYDEEVFIMNQISQDSKVRTMHFQNRELLIKASFPLLFDPKPSKERNNSWSPSLPPIRSTESRQHEPIDLEILDTDKPSSTWLSKLVFGKYNKPDDCVGPEAIKAILSLFDERKAPGFFLIYDLFSEQLSIKVFPDDSTRELASILLRVFIEHSSISYETTILQVMARNPSFVPTMPLFEDKRKLRIPKFSGLDIFQSHIKSAAMHILQNQTDLNRSKQSGFPITVFKPTLDVIVPPPMDKTPNFSGGRDWLYLKV